jgi:hypothetical protein
MPRSRAGGAPYMTVTMAIASTASPLIATAASPVPKPIQQTRMQMDKASAATDEPSRRDKLEKVRALLENYAMRNRR